MSRPSTGTVMTISAFKPLLDKKLEAVFLTAVAEAESIDRAYAELLMLIRDELLRGGKRLRPYLAYLGYLGMGGKDVDAIIKAAASQELLHHFLLIHDDVMDRDLIRHGSQNIAGIYHERLLAAGLSKPDAYHYSASYALLAGDASCALGLEVMTSSQFEPERKLAALACLQHMLFEVIGGQLLDVRIAMPGAGKASIEQLLAICHYKTAVYSFQTPLQVGAILAGASQKNQEPLLAFGHALGVAFQLTDDLLGVYGDEATIGKPVHSDMREGKQTLLIHFAREHATAADTKLLRQIWGNQQAGPEELAKVQALLETTGARQKVTAMAHDYLEQSLAALHGSAASPGVKEQLASVARFCVERQY